MRSVKVFAALAVVEAISWLLLIAATIVKYTEGNQVGVHVLGPIHGVLFLAYVALALLPVRRALAWDRNTTLLVLVESVLPGGGFLAARRARARTPGSAGPSSSGTPRRAGRR